MKEIRYAPLLHDFGKVGVREEVLVKAKKLPPRHLELIKLRGEILKRGFDLTYARYKLDHLLHKGREGFAEVSAAWDAELLTLTGGLQQCLDAATAANEPTVLAEDYKSAISVERALDILAHERRVGAIDAALLDLFTALKPWERRRD